MIDQEQRREYSQDADFSDHGLEDPNAEQGEAPVYRKVVAATAGSAVAAQIALVITFFTGIPVEIGVALAGLLMTAATFLAGYLTTESE